MRRHPTPTEHILWQAIRGGRLGVTFRRQVPLGPFIVDFLAPGARLVVEVDGGVSRAALERLMLGVRGGSSGGGIASCGLRRSVVHELEGVLCAIARELTQS